MTAIRHIRTGLLAAALMLCAGGLRAADEAKPAETTAPPTAPAADTVPLEIQLPKPLFVGTPKNIASANLEKPLGKARPPIQVPAGVVNLAAKKTVTSSDTEPVIGTPDMVTDGDKEGADGSYMELGKDKQYVQIDLGKAADLYAIVFWHYHSQARVYHDVVVQLADDADFITNVRTVFNNDHDNSSGLGAGKDKEYVETNEGRLVETKGAKARYVRLYSNGNTSNEMNHYIEVEVYGTPAK